MISLQDRKAWQSWPHPQSLEWIICTSWEQQDSNLWKRMGAANVELVRPWQIKMSKKQQGLQIAYKQSMLSGATPSDPNEVNLSQGLARTIIDQIIEYKCQERARNEALIQWEKELVDQDREIFDNCLKMTTGVVFWAGKVNLSNGTVVNLASNMHPDLAITVNQAAYYIHWSQQVHKEAIKQICRYLQGTKAKAYCCIHPLISLWIVMSMPTLPAFGGMKMTKTLFGFPLTQGMSSYLQLVHSCGQVSLKQKLQSQPWRLSILPYPYQCEISFLYAIWC